MRKWVYLSLLLTAVSSTGAPARAQIVQLYVQGGVAHVANAESGENYPFSPGYPGYAVDFTSFTGGALIFGATFNTTPNSLLSLGFDFRANTMPGTPGYIFGQEGLKLTARPPHLKFQPYFEVSVTGTPGHTRVKNASIGYTTGALAANPYTYGYYIYQGYLGADKHLSSHLDWRIVEVGGGTSVGSGHNGITLITATTGVVARF